ncbi:MAG: 16S rRNA (cytidine(1402)-2'-O)-methyltransferase [Candidatus Azambacteria bacterium]|nr:16S rRNA (cytidine(1402)-2'-O)-methyltransferase [Candidatus Azambacteria bacterium]
MTESIPTVYLIATPIGNLEDITMRAVRMLREVDLVLCEDTRVARKLLSAYDIKKPLESYHQHSAPAKLVAIGDMLAGGKSIAFVSDAGTPGISDPGGMLVRTLVERFGDAIRIVPIPGASAVLAALSISGFFTDRFRFLGFPPHKKGRKTFFQTIAEIPEAVVLYESKHRIEKALEALTSTIGMRQIVVARELTKQFESIYRGTAPECLAALKNDDMRGEFVVVIAPAKV